MLDLHVAERVHRVADAFVNWYLLEEPDGITAVDAGLPKSWESLLYALASTGRRLTDVRAIVLTHAHFDHVGFAERARRELGLQVWVHRDDAELARHPLRSRSERLPVRYMWRPQTLRVMGTFAAQGAFWAPRIADVRTFGDREKLPVPGAPVVVATPGHTLGHASLELPGRDAVITGDALVTLDPYTGRRGPRLVARAATADSAKAWASLDRLAELYVTTVLPGHGDPWREGMRAAVETARVNGQA
jgi:glyoxylase-like metal-dependent hydrolase (beta-lactamase superfamily II)